MSNNQNNQNRKYKKMSATETTSKTKDIQTTSKPGKRKLDNGNNHSCHGNTANNSVNKKEIQDGFSWWTSMMVGVDPKASQVVVTKVCQNKIDISSTSRNDGEHSPEGS